MTVVFLAAFAAVVLPLCLVGAHRLMFMAHRLRMGPVPLATGAVPIGADAPRVTIQLPLYNERTVARRIIEAAASIRYPRDRFEIQVLDDSADDTVEICRGVCAELREQGIAIEHLHREDRTGFKAGALAAGLEQATGELVAIFDADFVPGEDFLERTVPEFADAGIGMVQVRWDHLNRKQSVLTRLQGLLLDGHFLMESAVRHRFGVFFNFNGTAGIWRRRAIEDAGGWQGDTLTEDMDLSYRSQLAGWRFRFIESYAVPAEVPQRIRAFRSQQHRWVKGSIQVGRKMTWKLLWADVPLRTKVEALFHLYANLAFPLVLVMTLLLPAVLWLRSLSPDLGETLWWGLDLPALGLATFPMVLFYLGTEYARRALRPVSFLGVPMAMAMGLGMSVNNTRAVIEGLSGHQSPFVRTPKVGDGGAAGSYVSPITGPGWIELGIAAYYLVTICWAVATGQWIAVPFLSLFLVGFGYVGVLTTFEPRS